jgi:CHAD domain-containing protein
VADATSEYRERELKFDVPAQWELPELAPAVPAGAAVERTTVQLQSTYHDTSDHDLLRAGVTLRRRVGEADAGWQLKIPADDARTEVRRPLDDAAEHVPDDLATLTAGLRGTKPLLPVAVITTERAIHRLRTPSGTTLAEVVVDDVHGTAGGEAAVVTRWREVEVELGQGDEELLARLANRLTDSGARPAATTSKLARALDVAPPTPPPGLAGAVAGYLDRQYARIVYGDVQLRRGQDVVHRTRTSIRRYRSVLRVYADLMDADRAAALDAELSWFSQALGRVRDGTVLLAHLESALAEIPPELVLGPVAARIRQLIESDGAEARRALDELMAGDRYRRLLEELTAWHDRPPLRPDVPPAEAGRYLAAVRRKQRRRLRQARRAGAGAADPAMHRARKAAKRARYAAEVLEPDLGQPARKVRKKAKKVQGRLGDRQDSVVAADFLLRAGRLAGTTPGENGFTFGLLYQRERDAAARLG